MNQYINQLCMQLEFRKPVQERLESAYNATDMHAAEFLRRLIVKGLETIEMGVAFSEKQQQLGIQPNGPDLMRDLAELLKANPNATPDELQKLYLEQPNPGLEMNIVAPVGPTGEVVNLDMPISDAVPAGEKGKIKGGRATL